MKHLIVHFWWGDYEEGYNFELKYPLDENGKVRAQVGEALTEFLREVDGFEKERATSRKAVEEGSEMDAPRGP